MGGGERRDTLVSELEEQRRVVGGGGRVCASGGRGAVGPPLVWVWSIPLPPGSFLGTTFPGSSLTQASGAGGGQLGGCMGEPALAGDHMTGREAGLAPGKAQT